MTKNKELLKYLIKDALSVAIIQRRHLASSIFKDLENSRDYKCSIDNCSRKAYAKGYCNAHYMRSRDGRSLTEPIRSSKREDKCSVCGNKTGAKGGWGMCQKHYRNERYRLIKDTLVNLFGEECHKCNGKFPREVFDFHHIDKKDADPSHLIVNSSPDKIADEMSKCILLCANCHRIEHATQL